jgi:uncharacterized metal-binding protein YceD (DUF177 family)
MAEESKFIIRLNGLTVGSHRYEFEVNDSFFEGREYSEVQGAQVQVTLDLLKQNSLITLTFQLEGVADMSCDRCTRPFQVEISVREEMHLRFGNPDEDHPENVLVIPHGENELDITQPIYEFINLAIPSRRVPCEEDTSYKCDEATLKRLNDISADSPENKGPSIWDQLKNIDLN